MIERGYRTLASEIRRRDPAKRAWRYKSKAPRQRPSAQSRLAAPALDKVCTIDHYGLAVPTLSIHESSLLLGEITRCVHEYLGVGFQNPHEAERKHLRVNVGPRLKPFQNRLGEFDMARAGFARHARGRHPAAIEEVPLVAIRRVCGNRIRHRCSVRRAPLPVKSDGSFDRVRVKARGKNTSNVSAVNHDVQRVAWFLPLDFQFRPVIILAKQARMCPSQVTGEPRIDPTTRGQAHPRDRRDRKIAERDIAANSIMVRFALPDRMRRTN